MNLLYWLALCLSVILLVGCGVSDATPQVVTSVASSPTIPDLTNTTLVAPMPTQTTIPNIEPTIVSTERPTATVLLDIAACKLTFCPPYWLTDQANRLLEYPGIYGGEGLNEFWVLLSYDPILFTEEEVVQLFIEITGFDVDVISEGG